MDFPDWAPPKLVALYEGLLDDEAQFSETGYTQEALAKHANRNGFPTWTQCQNFLVGFRKLLGRLISDENARLVLEWIGDERTLNLVLRRIQIRLEYWHKAPLLTEVEFDAEAKEIADLSRKLASKLAIHIGNPDLSFSFCSLVPNLYLEQAKKTIHPEFVSRSEKTGLRQTTYLGAGLPPLHVMLNELSKRAKVARRPKGFPKKVHNNSGIRKLFLEDLCLILYGNGVQHSTAMLSTFVGLILDDPNINDATIRGDLNSSEWWRSMKDEWLGDSSAKD